MTLGGLPTKFGLPLVILSGLLFLGGVLVEGRAKIESDPIKWVDQDSQVVKDIETLEDETGFSSTLGILVAANNIYDQDVIDLIWDFTLDAEARDRGRVDVEHGQHDGQDHRHRRCDSDLTDLRRHHRVGRSRCPTPSRRRCCGTSTTRPPRR